MAIIASQDIGLDMVEVEVDHDPTAVSTDVPAGSTIIDANQVSYRKMSDGNNTDVEKDADHNVTTPAADLIVGDDERITVARKTTGQADVVLLYDFNGDDGDDLFIDKSSKGHIAKAFNGAALTDTQAKYGPTSLNLIAANSHRVEIVESIDWQWPANFCFEAWARRETIGVMGILGNYGDVAVAPPQWEMGIDSDNTVFSCFNPSAGNSVSLRSTETVADSAWHHYAMARSGTTVRLFLDGVEVGSGTVAAVPFEVAGVPFIIGARLSSSTPEKFFNGQIGALRITTQAVYTAGFTPAAPDAAVEGYHLGPKLQLATATKRGFASPTQITKLNAVEASATADQTNAEIKTAYEANADTNEFSDAEQTKLTGIETSATADQTNVEIKTAYEANSDTNEFSDAEQTKLAAIESSATADQTDAEIQTAYEANATVASGSTSVTADTDTVLSTFTVAAGKIPVVGVSLTDDETFAIYPGDTTVAPATDVAHYMLKKTATADQYTLNIRHKDSGSAARNFDWFVLAYG